MWIGEDDILPGSQDQTFFFPTWEFCNAKIIMTKKKVVPEWTDLRIKPSKPMFFRSLTTTPARLGQVCVNGQPPWWEVWEKKKASKSYTGSSFFNILE